MNLDFSSTFVDHVVGGLENILPRIPNVLFDLLVGIVLIRLTRRIVRLVFKSMHMQPGLRYVLTSLIETVLYIILAVFILQELGLNSVIYFFTGSIAAIGIAMAAGGSTLVADLVAGLFLAGDHDFNVGDEIAVMNDRPIVGVIERMDARRIRLRDSEGRLRIVPNSIVERKEWIVVRKRHEVTPLVKATKAARRITAAALERKALAAQKKRDNSENAQ
jgi:small-conductance mechanosensitive channel